MEESNNNFTFRKGCRRSCSNYRGISMLNVGYKIDEKIVNNGPKIIAHSYLIKVDSEEEDLVQIMYPP